jgi:hypothetical protein
MSVGNVAETAPPFSLSRTQGICLAGEAAFAIFNPQTNRGKGHPMIRHLFTLLTALFAFSGVAAAKSLSEKPNSYPQDGVFRTEFGNRFPARLPDRKCQRSR